MSAWGFLLAPLLVSTAIEDHPEAPPLPEINAPLADTDLFGELAIMNESAMSNASGGIATAVDIANLGINIAKNDGDVSDVHTNNTQTGQIANNVITDNSGITTVFNNTGNGVLMQSIVNINVFLEGQ